MTHQMTARFVGRFWKYAALIHALSLVMFVCEAALASAKTTSQAGLFHTRYTSTEWVDYYSPFGDNGIYFKKHRKTSDTKMYIAAGFGRTGTTSLKVMFDHASVVTMHESAPVRHLTKVESENLTFVDILNPESSLGVKIKEHGVALLDNPVGIYAWDLMDAFPDYAVILTLREADSWYESILRLLKLQSVWPVTDINMVTFAASYWCPPARHALRRYFENNAKLITTVPEDRFYPVDFSRPKADDVMARVIPTDKEVHVFHSHNTARTAANITSKLKVPRSGVEELSKESNVADLDLIRYMTPMAAPGGVPVSKHWFQPGRPTSSHPLVICAGFDGTGLVELSEAFRRLGRGHIKFPGIDMSGLSTSKPSVKGSVFDHLMHSGFNAPEYPPSLFDGVDLVMGHPVPFFAWDFLEAFPKAKIILTVRNTKRWLATMKNLGKLGFEVMGREGSILSLWVWGRLPSSGIADSHFVRKYLEHNNKIIHGVPKAQLLVWNIEENPSWEPLCTFLGEKVPEAAFPQFSPLSP